MRNKTLILLGLVFLLSSCSGDKGPRLPYLLPDDVVLAFGDSLTHGTGATPEQAYPRVLASLIQREVKIKATPGDKTQDALEKLASALDEVQPRLLILCIGGNDFLRKVPRPTIRKNMHTLLDMADQRQVPVLLLGVPRPGLFGLDGAPLYQEIATERGVRLDNSSVAEVLEKRDLKADPIHPNAQGYRVLAERIARQLREAGAI